MTEFGDFLYALRKEKGITQTELAEMLGITNKAVSKWETGDAMPETSLLLPISRIFGVTVDELLAGKRNNAVGSAHNADRDDDDEPFGKDKHLFTRGKDDAPKTLREFICGALCATTVLVGIIAYLILGAGFGLWNGYWAIVPTAALCCGMIGVANDLLSKTKRDRKISRGDNPYTDAACGLLMLTCIIVYINLGAFLSLWHPYWVIVACGAMSCGMIGAIGKIFAVKTATERGGKQLNDRGELVDK